MVGERQEQGQVETHQEDGYRGEWTGDEHGSEGEDNIDQRVDVVQRRVLWESRRDEN